MRRAEARGDRDDILRKASAVFAQAELDRRTSHQASKVIGAGPLPALERSGPIEPIVQTGPAWRAMETSASLKSEPRHRPTRPTTTLRTRARRAAA